MSSLLATSNFRCCRRDNNNIKLGLRFSLRHNKVYNQSTFFFLLHWIKGFWKGGNKSLKWKLFAGRPKSVTVIDIIIYTCINMSTYMHTYVLTNIYVLYLYIIALVLCLCSFCTIHVRDWAVGEQVISGRLEYQCISRVACGATKSRGRRLLSGFLQ